MVFQPMLAIVPFQYAKGHRERAARPKAKLKLFGSTTTLLQSIQSTREGQLDHNSLVETFSRAMPTHCSALFVWFASYGLLDTS
jgi:hypothetical protein